MGTTRTFAVIDHLVEAWTAAVADDDDVMVTDGPDWLRAGEHTPVLVIVGHTRDDTSPSAQSTRDAPKGLGGRHADEEWTVVCALSAVDGGTTPVQTARALADAVLDRLAAAVRADTTLGGVASLARVGPGVQVWQIPTDNGCECTVLFEVSGRSLL